MPFLTELTTKHLRGDNWEVTTALAYMSHDQDALIVVEKGFKTDYASIPGFLLSLFGRPSGDMVEPSVVHDWIYAGREHIRFTRSQADLIFREGLKDKGVGFFKRQCLYLGVRAGGVGSWKK